MTDQRAKREPRSPETVCCAVKAPCNAAAEEQIDAGEDVKNDSVGVTRFHRESPENAGNEPGWEYTIREDGVGDAEKWAVWARRSRRLMSNDTLTEDAAIIDARPLFDSG